MSKVLIFNEILFGQKLTFVFTLCVKIDNVRTSRKVQWGTGFSVKCGELNGFQLP